VSKRAIILAGGKGTRLKPYTISLPKPLVPVGDFPILEIILRQLKHFGFTHVTITVNHLAELIQAYCGGGSKWDIKIDYSLEEKPLSTMGPLTLINDLPDDFLVMNGDIITDLDFHHFFEHHVKSKSNFTISAYQRLNKIDYGVLTGNDEDQLVKFEEKPVLHYLVSMGIYMVSKKCVEYIPKNVFFGFDHLMNLLIKRKEYPLIKEHKGYWLDIGRPDDFEQAIIDNEKKPFIQQ
jgi:NDP-sugar pyrophosphorylase family protein